jgi:DinB superfamily
MDAGEREFLVAELGGSEARLLRALDGLSDAQWRFREGPERWSIAEIVEHLVVFEEFIRGAVQRVLQEAGEPEKRAAVAAKEPLVLGLAESRGTRFVAREATRPVGRWVDAAELVVELKKARAKTLAFVAEEQRELREHFFAHIVFGDLDCYQWLVVLARHMDRHRLQVEEVMGDRGFPGGGGMVRGVKRQDV